MFGKQEYVKRVGFICRHNTHKVTSGNVTPNSRKWEINVNQSDQEFSPYSLQQSQDEQKQPEIRINYKNSKTYNDAKSNISKSRKIMEKPKFDKNEGQIQAKLKTIQNDYCQLLANNVRSKVEIKNQFIEQRFQQIKDEKKFKNLKVKNIDEGYKKIAIEFQPLQQINTEPLSQIFNKKCFRLKQKLDRQKQKKSQVDLTTKDQNIKYIEQGNKYHWQGKIFPKSCRNSHCNAQRPSMNVTVAENVQIQSHSRLKQLNNNQQLKVNDYHEKENLKNANNDHILSRPSTTSRKILTQREMYKETYNRWKKLPEVVQREATDKKIHELKARIIRAKQHDLKVRSKFKSRPKSHR